VEEELPSVRAPLEGMLAMQRLAAMYTVN
jgi:hypothetical protein